MKKIKKLIIHVIEFINTKKNYKSKGNGAEFSRNSTMHSLDFNGLQKIKLKIDLPLISHVQNGSVFPKT